LNQIVKKIIVSVFIACVASLYAADNKFKAAVNEQKESDSKRRQEIVDQMHGILSSYNSKLKAAGIQSDLVSPIDEKKISNIDETKDFHQQKNDSVITAFAKIKTEIYDSGETLQKIGIVNQGEELELIEKTSEKFQYKGKSGRWFLVKKSNGDEGWIHASMLSKDKPKKTDVVDKKDDADDLSFNVPINGKRTSNFGSRVDPVTKKRDAFHSGIDIAAPRGTLVKASEAGVVRFAAFKQNGYGNLIIIEHAKGFATYYGHLDKISVKVGEKITKGMMIGAVGSTGKSTGPHLHFEVRKGDQALDPDSVIR
jgi:murein DD-endopeptidase MepM/ murein hydrolase activator NlpD